MEGKVLARIAAIAFVAIAITATVIEVTREEAPVPASTTTALQPSVDPLRATLRGCQQLGEAAASDADSKVSRTMYISRSSCAVSNATV